MGPREKYLSSLTKLSKLMRDSKKVAIGPAELVYLLIVLQCFCEHARARLVNTFSWRQTIGSLPSYRFPSFTDNTSEDGNQHGPRHQVKCRNVERVVREKPQAQRRKDAARQPWNEMALVRRHCFDGAAQTDRIPRQCTEKEYAL